MWRVNGRFLRSSVPSCHVPFAHTFLRLFVRSLHPITSRPGSSRLLTSLAASPTEPGLRRDGPIRRGNGMTRDRQPTQLMTRRTCYRFPVSPLFSHLVRSGHLRLNSSSLRRMSFTRLCFAFLVHSISSGGKGVVRRRPNETRPEEMERERAGKRL